MARFARMECLAALAQSPLDVDVPQDFLAFNRARVTCRLSFWRARGPTFAAGFSPLRWATFARGLPYARVMAGTFASIPERRMVDQICAGSNPLIRWLRQISDLRTVVSSSSRPTESG